MTGCRKGEGLAHLVHSIGTQGELRKPSISEDLWQFLGYCAGTVHHIADPFCSSARQMRARLFNLGGRLAF